MTPIEKRRGFEPPAYCRVYNYKQSRTRINVEHTFGMLKGRFQRLRIANLYPYHSQIKLILACCVLHNILVKYGNEDIDYGEGDVDGLGDVGEYHDGNIIGDDEAQRIRDALVVHMLQENV